MRNELVSESWIQKAEQLTQDALKTLVFIDKNGVPRSKACCLCDRLIEYDDERWVHAELLVDDDITQIKRRLSKEKLKDKVPSRLLKSYTAIHLPETKIGKELRSLFLSRRTYYVMEKVGKQHKLSLGCCSYCHNQIKVMKQDVEHMPLYFIANGLYIGDPPKCLEDLNECELAMISMARVSKHMFSVTAGAQKSIKGFHTLYESDIESVNGVINYFADLESEEAKKFAAREEEDDDFRRVVPQVVVVLTGAFTKAQKARVQSSFSPRWSKCQTALRWLKQNNRLYANFELEDTKKLQPIIIDNTREVNSENANVERQYEMYCVFPDANLPDEHTNGFENHSEFKSDVISTLLSEKKTAKFNLLCRPRQTVLKDYLGDNLLKAFPLLFPYGYGNDDNRDDGRNRSGVLSYYQYLMCLSNPNFHRDDICCIIYNMCIRKIMLNHVYLRSDVEERVSVGQLTNEQIEAAADRLVKGVKGSSAADRFIQATKATRNSVPHSTGAAKRARQRVLSHIAAFGPPSIMHTVTPEDGYNYRIVVYALKEDESIEIPNYKTDPDDVIFSFCLKCRNNRLMYPGLCAFDFKQIVKIIIKYVLGWNVVQGQSFEEGGALGEVIAFCHADEEQGRKTLHAHFLLWIKGFSEMMDIVRNPDHPNHSYWEKQLEQYTNLVVSNELYGTESPECRHCDGELSECYIQQLRTLRYGLGRTFFGINENGDENDEMLTEVDISGEEEIEKMFPSNSGNKDIMYCKDCRIACSSEELCLMKLKKVGMLNNANGTLFENIPDIFNQSDMRRQRMECALFNLGNPVNDRRALVKCGLDRTKLKLAVVCLRNLHASRHCATCFKKGEECRFHYPKLPSKELSIDFDDKEKLWFDINGQSTPRQLFNIIYKTSPTDVFVNHSSKSTNLLFGCNNNIILGITGASAMYVTMYTFKSTMEEDNKLCGKSTCGMVKKLNDHIKAVEGEGGMNGNRTSGEVEYEMMGLRAMIGSAFMAAQSHICSAPMASHCVRNGDRFGWSHGCSFVNIQSFHTKEVMDYVMDKVHGKVVLKSEVQNYLFRNEELENYCLYAFAKEFNIGIKTKESMELMEGSRSRSRFGIKPNRNGKIRIPQFNFMDIPDTRGFEGHNILTSLCQRPWPSWFLCMNEYAKVALTLFVPFRNVLELSDGDGCFVYRYQRAIHYGEIEEEFLKVLRNVQDCHNGFNVGRPPDPLQARTKAVDFVSDDEKLKRLFGLNEDDEDIEENLNEFILSYMRDANFMANHTCARRELRDGTHKLRIKSRYIRDLGANDCGFKNVSKPTIEPTSVVQLHTSQNALVIPQVGVSHSPFESFKASSLHELYVSWNERITSEHPNDIVMSTGATGNLSNIRAWAETIAKCDDDQRIAFTMIVASFVLQLHEVAKKDKALQRKMRNAPKRRRKITLDDMKKELQDLFKKEQLPGRFFLTGSGGSGKSRVTRAVLEYGKSLFENLKLEFTRQTILVTACTGAAAVEINGETTDSALHLAKEESSVFKEIDNFNGTLLVIVDEVSFMSKRKYLSTLKNLKILKNMTREITIPIVFAGDFSQLAPVKGTPLYMHKDFPEFWYWLSTFLELRTPHRFRDDEEWGKLLTRHRETGPSQEDVDTINKRVLKPENGLSEEDIPPDANYATINNKDRVAINDAIFMKVLQTTHSKDRGIKPPLNAICIKPSNIQHKVGGCGKGSVYEDMTPHMKDLLYATCSESHVRENDSKCVSPLLKMYYDQPIMNIENSDVQNKKANGTVGRFRKIVLKKDIRVDDLETILIDGYHVYCAEACQVESVELYLEDTKQTIQIESKAYNCTAHIPFPMQDEPLSGNTRRLIRRVKFEQFPLNISNARTVHKLQGKTLENLVISSFSYKGNWVCVVLSRVKSIKNLFLRHPLKLLECKGMSQECREFLEEFRDNKSVKKGI